MFLYINKLFFNNMNTVQILPNIKTRSVKIHDVKNTVKVANIDKDVNHIINSDGSDDFNPLNIQSSQKTQEELENSMKKKTNVYNWVIIGLVVSLLIILVIVAYYFIIIKQNTSFIPSNIIKQNITQPKQPITSHQVQQAQQTHQAHQAQQAHQIHQAQQAQQAQQAHRIHTNQVNSRLRKKGSAKLEIINETEPLEVSSNCMNDEPTKHELEQTLKKIKKTKQLKSSKNKVETELDDTNTETELDDTNTETELDDTNTETELDDTNTETELDDSLTKAFYSNLNRSVEENDTSNPDDIDD
jgi:hypothetical protein